jgi:hypothetical protein
VRAVIAAPGEGSGVGAACRVPRAVDPIRSLRRSPGRAVAVCGAGGGPGGRARAGPTVPSHPGSSVRELCPVAGPATGLLPRPFPPKPRRLRLRLSDDDPGQGMRHVEGSPACSDEVERRDLRHCPGVRAAPAADAGRSAGRGQGVRGSHPDRAPNGHPCLPDASGSRRSRGHMERLHPADGGGYGRGWPAASVGGGPGDSRRGDTDRLRPGRRGEGGGSRPVRGVRPSRRSAPGRGSQDERRRQSPDPPGLRGRPDEPPPSTCSATTAPSGTSSATAR